MARPLQVRGNALYGTDGKGDTSPIVTSSNGVRQGTHDLHPGSKFPAGALDALVGELAVTDGNGTVVGSLAVSGVEQGDGYVLFTLQSGRCALVAEGVEGGAAVDVDCDEAIAAVEAPTSGDRRLLAALEHGPAGRRLLIHSGVLLQYRYALAQARAESAEADLAACEVALAGAAYQIAMANNCQDEPGLNQADANDSGPCGSTVDTPGLAGEGSSTKYQYVYTLSSTVTYPHTNYQYVCALSSTVTTCCNEGCCENLNVDDDIDDVDVMCTNDATIADALGFYSSC